MSLKGYQYIIQSLMWKQCCNESQFKQMVVKCLNVDSTDTQRTDESQIDSKTLSDVVFEANRMMRPFNMQISRGPNESDGTVFYSLINNTDNEITRLSNEWTNKELLYLRKIISAIIESVNSMISSTKALNICREDSINFTLNCAENLLNKWCQHRWLEEVGGNYAVGVRSILEMNVYLREQFEIEDCFRCKSICIRGSNCMHCSVKLHFHCANAQFIPNNKCPKCSQQWAPDDDLATNEVNSSEVSDPYSDDEIQENKRSKRKKQNH